MTVVDNRDTVWYLIASEPGVKAVSSTMMEVDILHSSVKQRIPKDWLPIVFAGYETPLLVESVDNRRGLDSSDQSVNGWLSLIREELYSIQSVEDIFVTIEDNDVDVWVVIPERNLGVLRQLVEKEDELFRTLVSGESPPFLLDFHIIYRCGRNVQELAPTRAIGLPRQA